MPVGNFVCCSFILFFNFVQCYPEDPLGTGKTEPGENRTKKSCVILVSLPAKGIWCMLHHSENWIVLHEIALFDKLV